MLLRQKSFHYSDIQMSTNFVSSKDLHLHIRILDSEMMASQDTTFFSIWCTSPSTLSRRIFAEYIKVSQNEALIIIHSFYFGVSLLWLTKGAR